MLKRITYGDRRAYKYVEDETNTLIDTKVSTHNSTADHKSESDINTLIDTKVSTHNSTADHKSESDIKSYANTEILNFPSNRQSILYRYSANSYPTKNIIIGGAPTKLNSEDGAYTQSFFPYNSKFDNLSTMTCGYEITFVTSELRCSHSLSTGHLGFGDAGSNNFLGVKYDEYGGGCWYHVLNSVAQENTSISSFVMDNCLVYWKIINDLTDITFSMTKGSTTKTHTFSSATIPPLATNQSCLIGSSKGDGTEPYWLTDYTITTYDDV